MENHPDIFVNYGPRVIMTHDLLIRVKVIRGVKIGITGNMVMEMTFWNFFLIFLSGRTRLS